MGKRRRKKRKKRRPSRSPAPAPAKGSKGASKRPAATSSVRPKATQAGPKAEENEPAPAGHPDGDGRLLLSGANPMITGVCLLVILWTQNRYGETQREELAATFVVIWPVLAILWLLKRQITVETHFLADHPTAKNLERLSEILVRRTYYSILMLAACLYPVVHLSALPQIVEEWVLKVSPQVTAAVALWVSRFVTWIVSALGGWLGNILLGALGSMLYDQTKIHWRRRKVRRRRESAKGEEPAEEVSPRP